MPSKVVEEKAVHCGVWFKYVINLNVRVLAN